ncbi:MAG: sortase [Candidatus Paceibacterota bacterium]|jgi:LPXTG-site transpeptidase (sortase) family protein
MGKIINFIVRLIRVGKQAYTRKWSFFGIFVIAFLGSVNMLATLDLLPQVPLTAVLAATNPTVPQHARGQEPVAIVELPTSIEIKTIDLLATIENPTATDAALLDQGLLRGAVRYPTSAKLGETGNVVLFGHSSYLPVVGNQAYKTFNGIQKLAAGEVITVYSLDTAYTYRVRTVAKESADNNTAIPLSVSGKALTLVTCNSFATKADRFVVTADFVESRSISG